MDFKDYQFALKELYIDFDRRKISLTSQYVNDNNPYKIGDTITDHIGSIIVESIGVHRSEFPCATYYGICLKKDGTPKKNGEKRKVWQSNITNK